jgi:hypothetical protein
MRRSGQRAVSRAVFDDPNLISTAGLVPTMALAQKARLAELADSHTSIPTDKGANAGAKVFSLVAGMVAGADSIDDMALLRHGAMSKTLDRPYAPSTLGSFLRSFTFGHVRQLDAVASRFLTGLATHTQVLEGVDGRVLVDIDDTIIEVHGHSKQGAGFGYTGTRGLNALIATVTTAQAAPVIAAQRLRKGSCGSPRGADRGRHAGDRSPPALPRWLLGQSVGPRGFGVLRAPHRLCGYQRRSGDLGDGSTGSEGAGRDRSDT